MAALVVVLALVAAVAVAMAVVTRQRAAEESRAAASRHGALQASATAAEAQRDEAQAAAAHADERRAAAEVERDAAVAERDEDRAAREAMEAEVSRLRAVVQGTWSLELLRQVRLWLLAMGTESGASVPADTSSELAAALRMELDRLREETGLPGDLHPTTMALDVPAALAGLRLAQEVLAALSRSTDAVDVDVRRQPAGGALEIVVHCEGRDGEPDLEVPRAVAIDLGGDLRWDGDDLTIRLPPVRT